MNSRRFKAHSSAASRARWSIMPAVPLPRSSVGIFLGSFKFLLELLLNFVVVDPPAKRVSGKLVPKQVVERTKSARVAAQPLGLQRRYFGLGRLAPQPLRKLIVFSRAIARGARFGSASLVSRIHAEQRRSCSSLAAVAAKLAPERRRLSCFRFSFRFGRFGFRCDSRDCRRPPGPEGPAVGPSRRGR